MSHAITTIQSMDNEKTIDSREVAKMLGKDHGDLMESIRKYKTHLENGNFGSRNYFIPSTYLSAQKHTLPCYEITRKGCELVANKMAGAKGTQFTAAYVERFHQMEGAIATPSELILQSIEHIKLLAQSNVETEKRVAALTTELAVTNTEVAAIRTTMDTAAHLPYRRPGELAREHGTPDERALSNRNGL